MPLYEVSHVTPLSISQKDELAAAITNIHSTKFTTPRLFVNVSFTDASSSSTYVGGKPRRGNHIRGYVRAGPSRTQEDWNDLSKEIESAWDKIAGTPLPKAKGGAPDPSTELRSVIVIGGIIGGLEAGFLLPPAGGDVEWLKENWDGFNEKAAQGDEEMAELVQEVKVRGLMEGSNGQKRGPLSDAERARKMEEMLGWGDSA